MYRKLFEPREIREVQIIYDLIGKVTPKTQDIFSKN